MFAETQSKRLLSYDSCLVLAQNQIITNDFYSYYLYLSILLTEKKILKAYMMIMFQLEKNDL